MEKFSTYKNWRGNERKWLTIMVDTRHVTTIDVLCDVLLYLFANYLG